MTIDRRTLVQGMTGAALLAPYLTIEKAMAEDHMATMTRLLGRGATGNEQVAMLLYPGFTALDLVGPHFFFSCMMGATVHLVTTEGNLNPVASDLGLAIAPTITMAKSPKNLDVLFVGGGTKGTTGIMKRPDVMTYLADRGSRAKHITSVCTGSMALAKAGLLKGKRATSHWGTRPLLSDFGAIPVEARVVTDGNVTTGAGVSAGLDFALTLVAMLRGKAYAEALMLQAEYHPEPPFAGGTMATTQPDIGAMMKDRFAPVAESFRALAR
jgi:cyclohexyl-isocyanide hydratase